MTKIHPNCANNDCYGAFVATRSYGLYMTESLVFDDDSDPTWEHLGQVMQIKQFSFDYKNPINAQVCADFNTRGWIRKPQWGDDWVEILNPATIRATLAAAGHATSASWQTLLDWIDFWPNNTVYAMVSHGNSAEAGYSAGQYFLKSLDSGNTWYSPPTGVFYKSDYYCGPSNCGLGIQYGHTPTIAAGAVIYASARTLFGNRAGMVYSLDYGESWHPWDSTRGRCIPNFFEYSSGSCRPMASRQLIDSVYRGHAISAIDSNKHNIYRVDGWGQSGEGVSKSVGYPVNIWKTGWSIAAGGAVCHNHQQSIYTGTGNKVYTCFNLEGPVTPVWNMYAMPSTVGDIEEYEQGVLIGFWTAAPDSSDGQYHMVYSTNDFNDFYFKAGANPNREYAIYGEIQTGAIHKDCGGVAVNGLALWDAKDPVVPTPPPTGSGWPIWINAEARELRPDPSWDRLYVVAETVWPAGEGLWNQPLLFQFILSGDLASTYFENQGFLAFAPTINALGQNTIYSGEITYSGYLEMHVDSAAFRQAIVVGKFGADKQVYHNDDMSSLSYQYQSGWPIQGWQLAGAFGEQRVSSIAHASVIENDTTISKDQIAWPTNISSYPWVWGDLFAVPFVVNTQLREAYNLFVGTETTATEQPIRFINITLSGIGWEDRGGGLPELPVNDIERGDY